MPVISPLAPSDKRDWVVRVDGQERSDISSIEISSSFGVLRYGRTPHGYDSWNYADANGGVVVVPHAQIHGKLYVGLAREDRFNAGGVVENAPRGFTDANETPETAAQRELAEETGLTGAPLRLLPGAPVSCNNAFFETVTPQNMVHFFAVEVPDDLIEPRDGEFYLRTAGEGATRFVPIEEAVASSDMFTVAAAARLMLGTRGAG
jgi:ADP-ribose pyrophosphatase YjhB (NUDIX family)